MNQRWAFASRQHEIVRAFDADGRIEFDGKLHQGFLELRPVRAGISMYRAKGCSDMAYSLHAAEDVPGDQLVLGCLLDGVGTVAADGNSDLIWRGAEQFYAVSLSSRQITYHLQPGRPFQAMALMVTPEAMDWLIDDKDLPAPVVNSLRSGTQPLAAGRPLRREARRLAYDLLNPTYRGRMGQLHREAKVLELLALQLDALGDGTGPERGALSSLDLMRVREARERLLADLRDPPGLSELAASVGLTPKKLNRGFRALFGTTVFDYLAEARLQMARRMLDQGLDVPLKALAWRLGYNQASNFVTAFRRRFGAPPGAWRASGSEIDADSDRWQ